MRRRSFLAATSIGLSSVLAAPAIGAGTKTLIFVPQSTLTSIDPVSNASMVTRNLGLMIYESLYTSDELMNAHPQMVEADQVEDDGRRWTMRLRQPLRWHDGTPVLALDCVASLKRWMVRDQGGQILATRLDALEAPDDRTIVFRLNRRFPHLRALLGRFNSPAVMMPERIAKTDPYKPVPEAIGCGPFRFVADEQVIGSRAVFARFDAYVPRDEPASFAAGGRRVLLDRVEWQMIPDASTAANALVTGEVDWVEIPQSDLTPMLARSPHVKMGVLDEYGQLPEVRINHLIPPTANLDIRRAMLAAIDQREVMTAIFGDSSNWIAPVGFLFTGKPEVDDAGMDATRNRPGKDAVKAMLERAGYKGEKLVMLHAGDHNVYNPGSIVVADQLRSVGFVIDDQVMDWGTVMQRRTTMEPMEKGGWSLFVTASPAAEYRDPMVAAFIRGDGRKGFYGWPADARIEQLYLDWIDNDDPAILTRIEREWEQRCFEIVTHLPLGRFVLPAAWRDNVTGLLRGPAPVFWNVTKS
jgi:peptide/nickel transport system substrate-binding protein